MNVNESQRNSWSTTTDGDVVYNTHVTIDKLLGWAKSTSITILDIIIAPCSLTNSTLEVWTLLGVPWTWSKVPWDVGLAPLTLL